MRALVCVIPGLLVGASVAGTAPFGTLAEPPAEAPAPLAGATGATCISFDTLPPGTVVTDQFPEATFSSIAGQENVTVASDYPPPPFFICTHDVGGGLNCINPTFVDFTSPVENLTLLGIGINDVGVVATIRVFEGNVLTGAVSVVGVGKPFVPVPIDLTGFSTVTRIEIIEIFDVVGIGWGDFCFDAGAPGDGGVPATTGIGIALMVLLLGGGTAYFMRRK